MTTLIIFCIFLFVDSYFNLNRFTQKVMRLKSLAFCLGNFAIDLIVRLPSIFMIMLNFKYQDEIYGNSTPYLKNKILYFILLLASAFQMFTYFYIWSLKLKRDKPAKLIMMTIIILGNFYFLLKIIYSFFKAHFLDQNLKSFFKRMLLIMCFIFSCRFS